MDGAIAWLAAEGRTGQWGTDACSTDPRRVAAISSMATGRERTWRSVTAPWSGRWPSVRR
jgi:hypothetical protein